MRKAALSCIPSPVFNQGGLIGEEDGIQHIRPTHSYNPLDLSTLDRILGTQYKYTDDRYRSLTTDG